MATVEKTRALAVAERHYAIPLPLFYHEPDYPAPIYTIENLIALSPNCFAPH